MKSLPIILGLALVVITGAAMLGFGPVGLGPSVPPDAPTVSAPGPSQSRPTPRACAGDVSGNPALAEWRRAMGCP